MAIKITKSVINNQHSLIGFIVSGKESELGGIGSDTVERSVSINEMLKNGFSNKQMSVVNGKIITANNFKINQLPMIIFNGDGYYPVNNSVSLIGRFVQNNENIGFRVKFADGTEDNMKYETILQICRWYNPENFAIRTSAKGKSYICAKQGYGSIDELPATVIGEASTAKKTKSAAKEKVEGVSGNWDNGMDILDIYDFIASCNGNIIKLPTEKYQSASEKVVTDGAFSSLGIGEVASAKPQFNSSKLNVNANFKKVGNVTLNVNGMVVQVPTYTHRSKSIFLNGENYIKKFGITVPKENEEQLVTTLSKSLALEKMDDLATITPISQVLGNNNLAFYKVDTSKLDLIAPAKREKVIRTNSQLVQMCKLMYELRLIKKATGESGGLMKQIKDALGNDFIADALDKKVFPTYAMYTKEGLHQLEALGVNIYTGLYNAPYSVTKETANANYKEDDVISIEYTLDGYDYNKLTGNKILELYHDGDRAKLGDMIFEALDRIYEEDDLKEREAIIKKVN